MVTPTLQSQDQVEQAQALPADWDDLVCADPQAEFTQTAAWHTAIDKAYPEAHLVVLTVRRQGRLVAGLTAVQRQAGRLTRLDSSLEGTTGGPLLDGALDELTRRRLFLALVRAFGSLRRGPLTALGMALNADAERAYGDLLDQERAWIRHPSSTAVISLADGIEDVESHKLVKAKRNERNRGLRRGVEVFATRDPLWLARFYPLYLSAARHWGIVPVPEALLRNLLEGAQESVRAGDVFFTCATLEDRVIGGHLNLQLGDRVFAWVGVTDPAVARTHFPATVCLWGDLVEACRRQARWLDIGASDVAPSLLSFKKYFGATLEQRGYYTCESFGLRLARAVRKAMTGWWAGKSRLRWHDVGRRSA